MKLDVPRVPEPALLGSGGERKAASFSIFDPSVALGEPATPRSAAAGFFPVRGAGSSSIAILPNGEDSLAARIQTLQKARASIWIQALVFWGDESGLYIAELLKAKKKELGSAIDIRIIVDAYSNLDWQTQWMYYDLEQHGITVQGYELFYLQWVNETPLPGDYAKYDMLQGNKRFHDKLWIVDGETEDAVAVMGGLNIANSYFRVDPSNPKNHWRDQDIMVKGAVVKDLVAAFGRNHADALQIKKNRGLADTGKHREWMKKAAKVFGVVPVPFWQKRGIKKTVRKIAARDISNIRFEPAKCRFIHNRPRHGELHISDVYHTMIEDAGVEVLIANAYFIPSPRMIKALKIAVRKLAKVVLLSNSPETNDLPEITHVGRGYYGDILSANGEPRVAGRLAQGEPLGVEIWEWTGKGPGEAQASEGTIHAKYAVFDRKAGIVGSFNLDPRSDNLNSETVLVFESEPLARRLAKAFYENDLAHSRKLTRKEAAGFRDPKDSLDKLRKWFGDAFKEHL
ncbi:phosphatidylserine/phosphatidylglycerophosphate/cardiolipin synthase family protein [Elusimicrobiota bacterium]